MTPSLHGLAPSTPTKQRIWAAGEPKRDFDKWFLAFSNKYCLQLSLPDPSDSPSKRTARRDPNIKIIERLRVHYWRKTYVEVEDHFHRDACELLRKWVKKPRGDPDVTPRPLHLPAANSPSERIELLALLTSILDEHYPMTPSQPSSAPMRTSIAPAPAPAPATTTAIDTTITAPQSPSTGRQRSKRPSEEGNGLSTTKRPKSAASESPNDHDESILVRSARGHDMFKRPPPKALDANNRSHEGFQSIRGLQEKRSSRNNLNKSFYGLSESAATSKVSVASSVFDHGHEEPQTSQETEMAVDEPIQNKRSQDGSRPRASDYMSDTLYPSSSTKFALQTSFNKVMSRRREMNDDMSEDMVDSSSAMDTLNTYSEFSSPPEQDMIADGPDETILQAQGPIEPTSNASPRKRTKTQIRDIEKFKEGLRVPWPSLPPSFDRAPLGVRWEILRVFLHCGVDPMSTSLTYNHSWKQDDQADLWEKFRAIPALRGKNLPERSDPRAWAASLESFHDTDRVVVLSAILSANTTGEGDGNLFQLQLKPLKLELPHRLARRFGPDRFLDVLVPWPDSSKAPEPFKSLGEQGAAAVIEWLTTEAQVLLGRTWTSFFVKKGPRSEEERDGFTLAPEAPPKLVPQERVYFFAENGTDFAHSTQTLYPKKGEGVIDHTPLTRAGLLEWLIAVSKNQEQAKLKLFSRITLGLSRTRATVVVERHQIRHQDKDILSPTGKVMNDGIARASPAFFRKVRDALKLSEIPSAFQGRFGSAKGMWIRDTEETTNDVWIETFPSQHKWKCDYIDEDHRTFEVRNMAVQLKSANLNLQLLPILEFQSSNPSTMKEVIGKYLQDGLQRDLDKQKSAMSDPLQLRNWVHETSSSVRRQVRIKNGQVPWVGGLPVSYEERIGCLVDSGFHPSKLKLLQETAYSIRKQKCTELMSRLNVKIGCSTYAYMVVDFLGVLEEGEVHLGFSSKFEDEHSGFYETMLHDTEVLVTRSPAHYVSDVQRVRAVFKPELACLKDVIVFSTKGNSPLADMLSGGDYDGDQAWVCWEPKIVKLFQNAQMPHIPDLFKQGFLSKIKTTYQEMAMATSGTQEEVTARFIQDSFNFNMEQDLLGICTSYKEKLCYRRKTVGDEKAVILSTLLSNLVDRAKQGIVFTNSDWKRLRQVLVGKAGDPKDDAWYRKESWGCNGQPSHILDYLKFTIGQPTVQNALDSFNKDINRRTYSKQDKEEGAQDWDPDLTKFYHHFADQRHIKSATTTRSTTSRPPPLPSVRPGTWDVLFDDLNKELDALRDLWSTTQDGSFDAKVTIVYNRFRAIAPNPRLLAKNGSKTIAALTALGSAPFSQWQLLKASYLFKKYYKISSFVWYIAGQELCYLKAFAVSSSSSQGAVARPMLVVGHIYAGLRPDTVFARQIAANERLIGEGGANYVGDNDEEDYDDDA